mmetsp:Transcript_43721/g.85786  ORF Transcript_43721/g.85786 Transcript_43721/m.85786 type:complete len:86 (+) Transcript_43721:137-394(+)
MSTSSTAKEIPSEQIVTSIIYDGLSCGLKSAAIGLTAGALASLVVVRSGGTRKAMAVFGAGVGIGQAWTSTNMRLETTLSEGSKK